MKIWTMIEIYLRLASWLATGVMVVSACMHASRLQEAFLRGIRTGLLNAVVIVVSALVLCLAKKQ